jgi:predicted NUDIX family NTP pyrophosphohydrolase
MPPPQKLLKKDNQTDDHNKSVHEKWMEGYEYFWSPEGQEEYNRTNEEWKARERKHREETGADIDEPILDVRSPHQMDPN